MNRQSLNQFVSIERQGITWRLFLPRRGKIWVEK